MTKFWDSQYNRAQCLKLLGITGNQLNYLLKNYNVSFTKIGHSVIFSGREIFDIMLILYLKSIKYPSEVINHIVDIKNKCVQLKPGTDLPIVDRIGTEIGNYRVLYFPRGKDDLRIFVEIEKDSLFFINGFDYQDDEEKSFYLFLSKEQIDLIQEKLDNDVEVVSTLSLKPVVRNINDALQTASRKYKIPVTPF